MFQVTDKICKNCLLSDAKIVEDSRAEEIIKGCLEDDSYFICHQSSINEGSVCCKGFYDKYKFDNTLARVATIFKQVEFVKTDCKLKFHSFKNQQRRK